MADPARPDEVIRLFTTPADLPADVFLGFIDSLSTDPLIGELLRTMNMAFMAALSCLVAYQIVSGTMKTASRGEVLGDRTAAWAFPIRTLMAVAFLVPLASGWSVGQAAVLQMTRWGVGLGGNAWQMAQRTLPKQEAVRMVDGGVSDETIRRLFIVAVEQLACVRLVAEQQDTQAFRWQEKTTRAGGRSSGLTTSWASVSGRASGIPDGTCGAWNVADWQRQGVPPAVSQIVQGHIAALPPLLQAADATAAHLVREWEIPEDQIAAAVSNYRASMVSVIAGLRPTELRPSSWATAGTRWHDLARVTAELQEATDSFPQAVPIGWRQAGVWIDGGRAWREGTIPTIGSKAVPPREAVELALQRLPPEPDRLRYANYRGYIEPSRGNLRQQSGAADEDEPSLMRRLADKIRQRVGVIVLDLQPGESPMGKLAAVGHAMLAAAWGSIGLLSVGGLALGTSVASVLATLLSPMVLAMLSAGTILAYLLPLAPLVAWFLGVMAYLFLVVRMVLAVPVWAMAHLRMDGEGIAPQATHVGWVNFLRLLVTPVLMVAALLVSVLIIEFAGRYLLVAFRSAFAAATPTAGAIGLLWGGLVATILCGCLMVWSAYAALNLLRRAPEEVLQLATGSSTGPAVEDHNTGLTPTVLPPSPRIPVLNRPGRGRIGKR